MLPCDFQQTPTHGLLSGMGERCLLPRVCFEVVEILRRRIEMKHEFEERFPDRQDARPHPILCMATIRGSAPPSTPPTASTGGCLVLGTKSGTIPFCTN